LEKEKMMMMRGVRALGGQRHQMYTTLGSSAVPKVANEPFFHYAPGSKERDELRSTIDRMMQECPEIPCIVGGKEYRTGRIATQVMPTRHGHVLCKFHEADDEVAAKAVEAAMEAKASWENMNKEDRWAIFLKAADLLATKYRSELCAATMLGTGKNVWQGEIDSSVETIDFWRFAAKYASQIYEMQPPENSFGVWNRMEYRPLEGFVMAISPFNFIAIGANLHSSPNIMGNTSVWKPSHTTMLGSYTIYKILEEAGLPPGVVNMIPGTPEVVGKLVDHPDMGGLHFTGSTRTFNHLWKQVANNIENYKSYPRIVGETGGKNFHFVHESADIESLVNSTVRGAFEYQGQKCSATSRMYVPTTIWPEIKEKLVERTRSLKQGCVTDFDTFVAAVIDETAFDRITPFIDEAKSSSTANVIVGGGYDKSQGYFIEPTIIETRDPRSPTMVTELFAPVLTVYPYDPKDFEATLKLCDTTSPYALTGAVWAQDREVASYVSKVLRNAAGNFYINDKSTGSIVGQQPFGGARRSGTNDKSGSMLNLLRWVSVRSTKDNFLPCDGINYPHEQEP